MRRPLRVHKHAESAPRVAKALNSNMQDVTQDGVHAEYVKEQGGTSLCNVNKRRKVPIIQEQESQ